MLYYCEFSTALDLCIYFMPVGLTSHVFWVVSENGNLYEELIRNALYSYVLTKSISKRVHILQKIASDLKVYLVIFMYLLRMFIP